MNIEEKGIVVSELVEQCYRNNTKAYMQLYNMYAQTMFNASLRILNDKFLAEDIMQEAFLTAFEKIKECKTPEYFGSWLKRIVINRSIDELRRKKLKFNSLDETYPIAEEPAEIAIEEEKEHLKLLEYVKQGIKLLPDGYRIILVLRLIEDYEYKSIAQELGIAESSVRSQYVRGRQKLLEIIENIKKAENARV
jgi:RNA polymerase sigma-70 factor (ECF subfamily)